MPGLVLDRYNAVQKGCFCGVFPEIKRAWASVDNSLFLWRYDRWCVFQALRHAQYDVHAKLD